MHTLRYQLSRWTVWGRSSVNRRIFVAAVTVGVLSLTVRLISMAKELVVARQFGRGDALDAFLIAFVVPSFVINIVAGSFNSALIPTYIRVRDHEGPDASQRLFSSVMINCIALLLLFTAILAFCAPYFLPLLGSGFGPDKIKLTVSLFYILLPVMVISGISVMWSSVLNASERFALAAASPAITPIASIILILAVGDSMGIFAVAIGVVGGMLLELILLAIGLKFKGISSMPRWYGSTPSVKQVKDQYIPMLAGAFLMSGTNLVDQAMAAMLGSGSVSALSYGSKVTTFVLSLCSMALGTALLPHFSKMTAERDWQGIRSTLRKYFRPVLMSTCLLSVLFVYFSEPVTRLLFQRGLFTEADTILVSRVQEFNLLQIPFVVTGVIGVRLISALAENRVLMVIAFVNFIMNILANYFFMRFLGVAGIALSSSLVRALSFLMIFYSLSAVLKNQGAEQWKA